MVDATQMFSARTLQQNSQPCSKHLNKSDGSERSHQSWTESSVADRVVGPLDGVFGPGRSRRSWTGVNVRLSVRGLNKTGRSPYDRSHIFPGYVVPYHPDLLPCSALRELHAPFLKERRTRSPVQCSVQEIRGISLVFREMWDTTALNPQLFPSEMWDTTTRNPRPSPHVKDLPMRTPWKPWSNPTSPSSYP